MHVWDPTSGICYIAGQGQSILYPEFHAVNAIKGVIYVNTILWESLNSVEKKFFFHDFLMIHCQTGETWGYIYIAQYFPY